MFFTWTNKLNLFSTIFFLYLILKSEKKLDLNYIHSHEFFVKCHNIFLDLKIYILLQKKLDNEIPYPEVRKGFVF